MLGNVDAALPRKRTIGQTAEDYVWKRTKHGELISKKIIGASIKASYIYLYRLVDINEQKQLRQMKAHPS
jgi:hypothetical protein